MDELKEVLKKREQHNVIGSGINRKRIEADNRILKFIDHFLKLNRHNTRNMTKQEIINEATNEYKKLVNMY